MANNPYNNKIQLSDGTTIMDITDTTAVDSDVAQGKYFYAATGEKTLGTASGGGGAVVVIDEQLPGGGTAKHITAVDISDTTAVASDVASGKYFYTSSGIKTAGTASGGSSWTKVAETSYQVSYAETTTSDVATWATGHSEIWTKDKFVYIRIRDTAGKRNGYFYGSDTFFINSIKYNYPNDDGDSETTTGVIKAIYSINDSGFITQTQANTTGGYGVFTTTMYRNGSILIRKRYNSSYPGIIDGTYKVEVYLLDPPTGAPIFPQEN